MATEQPSPSFQQQQQQQQQNVDPQSSSSPLSSHLVIPFSATYPSFSSGSSSSGKPRILNPSISDMELIWNFIKVGFYFGTLLFCLSPVLNDACAYPAEQEELEQELNDLLLLEPQDESDHDGDDTTDDGKKKSQSKKTQQQQQQQSSRWASLRRGLSTTARTVKAKTMHALRVSLLLAFVSVCTFTTWTFILAFLQEDRERYVEFSQWLARSDWMVASYELVSMRPEQWFWSAQLLLFVVPMTLYIVIEYARSTRFYSYLEEVRSGVTVTKTACEGAFQPLSNLWLGCGLAISVSFPLAMSSIMIASWNSFANIAAADTTAAAAAASKAKDGNSKVNNNAKYSNVILRLRSLRHSVPLNPWFVLIPLIIAFICVIMIPVADASTFGIVLGGLHFFIVLPPMMAQFFPQMISSPPQSVSRIKSLNTRSNAQYDWQKRTADTLWIPVTFAGFAAAIFSLHVVNFLHVVGSSSSNRLFSTIFVKGFCYNNCQCSISLDVVQCSIAVMIFVWFLPHLTKTEKTILCCCTPLLSLGVTFSSAIALNELRILQLRLNTSDPGELFDVTFPSKTMFDEDTSSTTIKFHGRKTTTTMTISNLDTSFSLPPSSKKKKVDEDLNGSTSFRVEKSTKNNNNNSNTKRTYLDDEDQTEEELFNVDPKKLLSSKNAEKNKLVKKKQDPIRPIVASPTKMDREEKEKARRDSSIILSDDDDDDEEEEDDEEFEEEEEAYEEEEERSSEGKSNEPRHTGDDDSRSSGMSGVYSETEDTS